MPIIIPKDLPANSILSSEYIFVMNKQRALHQDIRALKILLVNLMPAKIETETQIARLIGNTPLQVELLLLKTASYDSQNTDKSHLDEFYRTFDEIKDTAFDGMIVTGAPVEHLEFEEVDYWDELKEILEYAEHHVHSTLFICWGAQAALYHYYGVNKYPLAKKCFGVFPHRLLHPHIPIFRGFDTLFNMPHSRHTTVKAEDIQKIPELNLLAASDQTGPSIVATTNMRKLFVFGHMEYDPYTIKTEYERDKAKGLEIDIPHNYFEDNDPGKDVLVSWRSHGHLIFFNWINYCVYQETPFDLDLLGTSR